MSSCDACGRPVALARASCLYCGAALAALVPPAAQVAPAAEPEPRALLVLVLDAAPAERVAEALGVHLSEAMLWARRGGWRLLRAGAREAEARAEAERLAGLGIGVVVLAAAEVERAREPLAVLGIARRASGLELRLVEQQRRLVSAEVLLLVQGPIRREYQAIAERRGRPRSASLTQGHRFHLHLADHPRPLELDPDAIEFDDDVGPGSSLGRLTRWLADLMPPSRVDDGFRFVPPALGPELPSAGRLQLAAALGAGRREEGLQVLDNAAQFRFYSAWRGLAERQRRNG